MNRSPSFVIGPCILAIAAVAAQLAFAAGLPTPGSPDTLIDWRGLSRPPVGAREVLSDPWGKRKLEAADGGFLVLDTEGPGVLDHVWSSMGSGTHLTIEVDGKPLWRGPFGRRADPKTKGPQLFPDPILFDAGGMQHLLAPIGFARRLRLVTDKPSFRHFVSYRT